MDIKSLQDHVDKRFDSLEHKLDGYASRTDKHSSEIEHLQGFAKLLVTILLAMAGFFAVAYFNSLQG